MRVSGLPEIARLQHQIERRLAAKRGPAFSSIVAETFEDLELHKRIDPIELATSVATDGGIDLSHPSEEAVPLFYSDRFSIYAHFWIDAFAIPHTHPWEGGFQVLAGTSIVTRYAWSDERVAEPGFRVGTLRATSMCLLRPGDIQRVKPGLPGAHSIVHLERPSVSLRVSRSVRGAMALDLSLPGVGVETLGAGGVVEGRLKCLKVLSKTCPEQHDAVFEDAIRTADLRTIYLLLDHGRFHHADRERVLRLVRAQRARLGDAVDAIAAAADERMRMRWFAEARVKITAADHRFFLGLMCFCPDREAVFRLIDDRDPGADPVELLIRWTRELTHASSGQPLGFATSEPSLKMLARLLQRDAGRLTAELRECEQLFKEIYLFAPLFRHTAS